MNGLYPKWRITHRAIGVSAQGAAGIVGLTKLRWRVLFMAGLLWTIIVVLFVLWLIGFAVHIGGGLIHLLLVIAVILIVVNLLTGRGARL
jgi:hypothetical protein